VFVALGQQQDGVPIADLLAHWISFVKTFPGETSRISYLGLVAILKCTCHDVELASIKIRKGGKYSEKPEETVLLQTKLVAELAQFLAA